MRRSEALQLGADLWRSDIGTLGIPILAETGLFNHMEIAQILGVPQLTVYRSVDLEKVPKYTFNQSFELRTLDAMMVIAKMYEDGLGIAAPLVQLCIKEGTAVVTIARLTGVPKNELEDALHLLAGEPDAETV